MERKLSQGLIPEPFRFILYMNDLLERFNGGLLCNYRDDTLDKTGLFSKKGISNQCVLLLSQFIKSVQFNYFFFNILNLNI